MEHQIPEHIQFLPYDIMQERYYHKHDDQSYTIIHMMVNQVMRQYYIKEHCYMKCTCGQPLLKFGLNPNNNCLNVYCAHCNYKFKKGVSQIKNGCKRDNKDYAYFKEHQEQRDRLYCEICLTTDCLEIHHIEEYAKGGTHEAENLQLLCHDCHTIVHSIRKLKGV